MRRRRVANSGIHLSRRAGGSDPPSVSAVGMDFAGESISGEIMRRLAGDPWATTKPRPTMPQSDDEKVMKFTDCLAYGLGISDHYRPAGKSRYVGICALSELLRGQIQSGALNQ